MFNKSTLSLVASPRLLVALPVLLASCGGGDDPAPAPEPPITFFVSGAVTGTPDYGVLMVSLNGGLPEPIQIASAGDSAGTFSFPDRLFEGASYQVSLADLPPRIHCEIENGSGVVRTDNITNISVNCTPVALAAGEFTLSGSINGLANNTSVQLSLNGEEQLVVSQNGRFMFETTMLDLQGYQVDIERDPARQECEIENGEGLITANDAADIIISCEQDGSAGIFATDRLHNVRITMTAQEWLAFVLDTERARYTNGDAHGWGAWNLWTHSEVYREVTFEYLDDNGDVIEQLDHVAFKMRGNTSRQWPEKWYQQDDESWTAKPSRFHFSLKFDEEFDDDESVYACIDDDGEPAAVDNAHCSMRVGRDIPDVPDNDGREFNDVEKLYFKFNKDDPSYQREMLAHDLLNTAGIPTSRMAHASVELVLTGEQGDTLYGRSLPQRYNMGVFMMDEPVDKPYLKRYFGENGYLFKVGGGDLSSADAANPNCTPYEDGSGYVNSNFCLIGVEKSDPEDREDWLGSDNFLNPDFVNSDINDNGGNTSQFAPYRPTYDMKSKKKSIADARVELQNFMHFVQSEPTVAELAEQFDIDGFVRAQAGDIVVGAVDHYVRVANNYYLYLNPITEKWTYLTYDYDFTFRDNHPDAWGSHVDAFRDVAGSYVFPGTGSRDWRSERLQGVTPILWDIVFADDVYKRRLYQEIKRILDTQMDWDSQLKATLASRREMIESTVLATDAANPPGCELIYDSRAIDAAASTPLCDSGDVSMKAFIQQKVRVLRKELAKHGIE
ncbi:CotH kinase family protein [Agarivorans sp. TSD2052]|uniref:CotH kinase family protein n=1 Tax=Agarivorans sp. TSD2052 TaxID=2937286 RepID=UPI00200E0AF0|nr:CotH kinase family protein [Agarivorans sp. TSD2052]UPW16889.1 CotH kinase family protein [Agarivorans sp. TSD2052]